MQPSLVMVPIYMYVRHRGFPAEVSARLASGESIGWFGLTESDHGDPGAMITRVRKGSRLRAGWQGFSASGLQGKVGLRASRSPWTRRSVRTAFPEACGLKGPPELGALWNCLGRVGRGGTLLACRQPADSEEAGRHAGGHRPGVAGLFASGVNEGGSCCRGNHLDDEAQQLRQVLDLAWQRYQ